ncbi:fibronectin type III domain-containing protein, partial [Paenibacillus xanthanilyticus]
NDGNTSTGVNVTAQTKQAPTNPTNVKAEPSLDKLKLTWTDPTFADLKHIRITWREEGAAAEQGTVTVEKGAQTHTITGLKSGTKYEVTLVAVDTDGNASTGVKVTAQTKQAPTNPTNVKAEPSLDKLKLTWTDPTFADLKHIRITWREEGAAAEQGTATVEKGVQTHTFTSLKSGTKYEVTLIALDNDGNASTGVKVTAQTKQAPTNPTNVKAEPSLDKLKLTWTDPTFADLKEIRIT